MTLPSHEVVFVFFVIESIFFFYFNLTAAKVKVMCSVVVTSFWAAVLSVSLSPSISLSLSFARSLSFDLCDWYFLISNNFASDNLVTNIFAIQWKWKPLKWIFHPKTLSSFRHPMIFQTCMACFLSSEEHKIFWEIYIYFSYNRSQWSGTTWGWWQF